MPFSEPWEWEREINPRVLQASRTKRSLSPQFSLPNSFGSWASSKPMKEILEQTHHLGNQDPLKGGVIFLAL